MRFLQLNYVINVTKHLEYKTVTKTLLTLLAFYDYDKIPVIVNLKE